jgi:hypothetical protein
MSSAIISISSISDSPIRGIHAGSTSERVRFITMREAHRRSVSFGCRWAGDGGLIGSGRTEERDRGAAVPSPLHILQLFLGHPKIVPEFMYESLADLMSDFSLIGADRFNILLIKHDVGRADR